MFDLRFSIMAVGETDGEEEGDGVSGATCDFLIGFPAMGLEVGIAVPFERILPSNGTG